MDPNQSPQPDQQNIQPNPTQQGIAQPAVPSANTPQIVTPTPQPQSIEPPITTPTNQPTGIVQPQQPIFSDQSPQLVTEPADNVVHSVPQTQLYQSENNYAQSVEASVRQNTPTMSPPAQTAPINSVSNIPSPQVQQAVLPAPPLLSNVDSKKPKTPLVTLAAQLTFRGTEERRPKTLIGKILGIFIIIVALAGSAGFIYAAQHVKAARKEIHQQSNPYAAKNEEDKKKAIADSSPETQKLKDGKLDVSKLFDTYAAEREQDIKAEYNEQINVSDGTTFAVVGSTRGWMPKGKYASKPAKGKEYIKIDLLVGYRGKEGTGSIYELKLQNSKGGLQDTSYVSDESSDENGLGSLPSITPGGTAEGWLVFEVDKGEPVSLVLEKKGLFDAKNKEYKVRAAVEIKQ